MKCDGTHAETSFRLSAKWTSLFRSAGASVQSTAGSRGVRISGSNAGHTMSQGSMKGTGYPLHSPVYPSLPLPCVTVCHHVLTGLYHIQYPHITSHGIRENFQCNNKKPTCNVRPIENVGHRRVMHVADIRSIYTALSIPNTANRC